MRRRGILLCAVPPALLLFIGGLAILGKATSPTSVERIGPPPSLLLLAQRAFENHEYPTCEDLLRSHLKTEPASVGGLLLLAQVFSKTDRGSDCSSLLLNMAQSHVLDEEGLRSAISTLTEVAADKPMDAVALKSLAICYSQARNSHAAMSVAHRALERNPNDPVLISILSGAAELEAASNNQSHIGLGQQPVNLGRRTR